MTNIPTPQKIANQQQFPQHQETPILMHWLWEVPITYNQPWSKKTLRSVHFGVVVVELINCKCRGIVRNQIW